MDLSSLAAYCESIRLAFPAERATVLEKYLEALYDENVRANITRVPIEQAVVRHLIDSALVIDLVPRGARCLDIGSGPGLPGFVIACLRPDTTVVCMEATGKMTRPLEKVRLPNLTWRVHRAEEVDAPETFDFVTGRAVAPLAVQLEISATWCAVGGCVVPFRTSEESSIIQRGNPQPLGLVLEKAVETALPGADSLRLFPVYRKSSQTPAAYPRRWAEIKKRPLF